MNNLYVDLRAAGLLLVAVEVQRFTRHSFSSLGVLLAHATAAAETAEAAPPKPHVSTTLR